MLTARRVVVVGVFALVAGACAAQVVAQQPEARPTLDQQVALAERPSAADTSLCALPGGPSCVFDADNFDNPTVIDNPYLPMKPGTRWVYEGTTNEDELV
ncbi:MAG: hypothetical protein HKN93_05510, partial [Acidimicrobiia bacterium]|nr:hypothetical protein [Acidimicrobiia bacterium]